MLASSVSDSRLQTGTGHRSLWAGSIGVWVLPPAIILSLAIVIAWRTGGVTAAGSIGTSGADSSRGAGGDTCSRLDRLGERGRLSRSVRDIAKSASEACAGAGGQGVMCVCDRHVTTGND